jgi:uncharacterized protein (TIGR03118 family)
MNSRLRFRSRFVLACVLAALPAPLLLSSCGDGGGSTIVYQRTNLVSNVAGLAATTDPNLVNAWGIARNPTGPFWVADNGTGVSTLYDGSGDLFPVGMPLVVSVPPPEGSAPGAGSAPTGIVFNGTSDFVVTEGENSSPALFIFSTEDGTISGWSPNVDATAAILTVDDSDEETIYKGLAIGTNADGNFLYATNFHGNEVAVYDRTFAEVDLAGSFTDPSLPAGFAPFGIQNISGALYVTYAKQDADGEDDVPGPGNGYVDVFDTDGNLIGRFASQGSLNSPWGLALAPPDFGPFSNAVLVGNFGDGRVNAFDPVSGDFLGQLTGDDGSAITIDGLWGLSFGNGGNAGAEDVLFFTAGINDEQDGLFGSIQAVSR